MTDVSPLVRVRAHLHTPDRGDAVHDGDTYWFLLDLGVNGFREGAQVQDVRLRDYSARELRQGAELDAQGNVIRVAGREAQRIAERLLTGAKEIVVQPTTRDKYGRSVGFVWIDGQSLGEALLAEKAVVHGSFMGVDW